MSTVQLENELIDLVEPSPYDDALLIDNESEPAPKRLRQADDYDEHDDDVIIVGSTRTVSTTPVDEVVEVTSEQLSGAAKDKLLQRLLAEKHELRAQVESLSSQRAQAKKATTMSHVASRPGYWRRDGCGRKLADHDTSGRPYRLVQLDLSCPEGESVARRFANAGLSDAEILSVSRCHNYTLWEQYAQRRAKLTEMNGDNPSKTCFRQDALPGVMAEELTSVATDKACERYLFHGASPHTVDAILEGGVDFRLSLPTGAMGACAYFADQSSYSHSYCVMAEHSAEPHYAGQPQQQQQMSAHLKMLLCRVLLGHCTLGSGGLRRPPPKHANSTELYDSVSNSPTNAPNYESRGFMFGVFDNAQVYPEYVIEYLKSMPDHHRVMPIYGLPASFAAASWANQLHTPPPRPVMPKPVLRKRSQGRRRASGRR